MSPDAESATPWPDRLGMVASGACAVHCVLVAAMPLLLASVGLALFATEAAEWALVTSAIVFGLFALSVGFHRHQRGSVAALMALGVVGLLLCRIFESHVGPVGSVLASSLMIVGHLLNSRAVHRAHPARQAHPDPT